MPPPLDVRYSPLSGFVGCRKHRAHGGTQPGRVEPKGNALESALFHHLAQQFMPPPSITSASRPLCAIHTTAIARRAIRVGHAASPCAAYPLASVAMAGRFPEQSSSESSESGPFAMTAFGTAGSAADWRDALPVYQHQLHQLPVNARRGMNVPGRPATVQIK